MGGTSTDVCLIADGHAERTAERAVGGLPIRLPTVDLHTVGAGGGSIVWRDAGGALRVGPQSAGADPGPACYGRGGLEPTVTDANLAPRTASGARSPAASRSTGAAAERALGGLRPGGCDRRRQRGDAARATPRLGRARPRPPRLRARRLRRRRARCTHATLADELGIRNGPRPGGGGRPLGARARGERRAARPRALVRHPARGGGRSCRRRRGRPSLPRPVVRAHRAARGEPGRGVPPRARGALRLRRPRPPDRARRRAHRRGHAAARARCSLPASRSRLAGPAVVELDGATCWVPPGWEGARDGNSTWILTRP